MDYISAIFVPATLGGKLAAPQGGGAQRQSNPLASPNCNDTECPPCNSGTGPSRAGSAYYLVQCEGWAIPFQSMNSSTEWRLPIADNAVNSEFECKTYIMDGT